MITADQINQAEGLRRDIRVRGVDSEARTVEVAFASEEPVRRWFGEEVLEVTESAIDATRLRAGGAVLLNHDPNAQVGVVEEVTIADGRARARLRFGRGARAAEVFDDITDGIRRHVSVGYAVERIEVEPRDGQPDLVRVTRWTPLELSIVSIPADATVGVGRNHTKDRTMSDPTQTPTEPPATGGGDTHVAEVLNLGRAYDDDALAARILREGGGPAEMQAALLERMNSRGGNQPLSDGGAIGLTERERRSYSLVNLVRHLAEPSSETAETAAFELEASRAFAQRTGRAPQGAYIPDDVLMSRDFMNTGTPSQGGALVAEELMAGSFIDMLRNRLAVMRAGALVMRGLVGNIAIPRLAGGATHEWLPEAGNVTDSKPATDLVTMTPHTVAASVPITRRLLLQATPDIENMIRRDLVAQIALAIDAAALNGDESEHAPEGLREKVEGDALDWDGTLPTFEEMVELETRIAGANADEGALRYIYNASMGGHLKTTTLEPGAAVFVENGGVVNGFERIKSNQAKAGDAFFGNWGDMIIGMWSGLDLRPDVWTLAASDGLILRAFQDVDVAIRHPESFTLGRAAPAE